MSNWDELSLRDKAEFIKVGVRNGLTSISDIKELYNKFLDGGPKKLAWVRYFRDVPEEFRDPNVDYEKEKNTKIWTDELGKPISRADLVNYDTSQRLLYNPTPNSYFNLPLVNNYDRAFINLEKRKQKSLETIQTNKDIAAETLEFTPIIGDIIGGYKDIVLPLQLGDYLTAGVGAGMMLLPNFLEKPFKYVGKAIKKRFSKKPDFEDIINNIQNNKLIIDTSYKTKKSKKQYIPDQIPADDQYRLTAFWNDVFLNKYNTNRLKFHDKTKIEDIPGEFYSIKSTDANALKDAAGHSSKGHAYIYSDIDAIPKDDIVIHEGTHNFRDTNTPTFAERMSRATTNLNERPFIDSSKYTSEEISALDNAYTFTSDYNYNNLDKNYLSRLAEKGATNTELQYALYKKYNVNNKSELNNIIDNLTDDDLLYELVQTNSYSRNFVKHLRSLPKEELRKKVISIRKALKYVPIITGVGIGAGYPSLNESKDNKFQKGGYKQQIKENVYNSYDNIVNKFGGGGFISVEEYAKMSREEQRLYVESLSSLQRRAFYGHLRQGSKKREQQNRRSKQNNSLTLNTSSKSNKGVEDAYMIMDAMTKSVSQSKEAAKALGMAAVTALLQSRDRRQEKKQEAETFLNAAEVASGVLGLSKLFPLYTIRPKELRLPWYKQLSTKLSNFANDNTTNITNSLAGTYIDWSQLLSSLLNGLSTLENSIEAPISTGGLLQAYGVFPTTNRFGRFINPFLNFAGYTTNIYDVTKPFRSDNEESNLDTN